MTMFRFPSMKQVFGRLFSQKTKKDNRQSRHLTLDTLEARELLTVSAGSSSSYFVNELPIYETNSTLIEQIQNLKDNNYSIDYDLGGDEDGDIVIAWERPDVIYTTKEGETDQYAPVIDQSTLSPSLDWNIYARYLTNETQRITLDTTTYDPSTLIPGQYNTMSLFYGQTQHPTSSSSDDIASGLVLKISFTSEAQPLTSTQESINGQFSIYAYDSTGVSVVQTFTFQEQYETTLSIDGDGVLDYTQSMERNAQDLQDMLRGLGQTQGKFLNNCQVKAISPTEFYVYVYSDEIAPVWNGNKWVYNQVPSLAIYQENVADGGFEVSANVEVVSTPCLYNNIIVDPTNPLQTAKNIQKSFDAKKTTNLMAPIVMPGPDRINAQRTVTEGPATESAMLVSGGVYPEVLVVPVYGLTDANGNSLDGYVYDITFVGDSSYINHPLLTGLDSDGTNDGISVITIKESSSEFRVNDPEPDNLYTGETERYAQLNPSVAMDADGDFVITWQSEVSNTLKRGSYTDIYAKTYSARSYINDFSYYTDPTLWPEDMMINTVDTYTFVDQGTDSYYQKKSQSIYIQSVTCTSDQFLVNTSTTNAQRNPDVAMDLDGNFVIVWDSEGQTISYFNGVYMQRFAKDGKSVGKETRVDTEVTGAAVNPTVAANDDGQFVVAWEYTNNPLIDIQFPYYTFYNSYFSYYYETDFYYESEIKAAVFNAIVPIGTDFQTIAAEFTVGNTNVETGIGGKDPSVTWDDCGDYIIGWTSMTGDTDTTGDLSTGVYAVMYRLDTDENNTITSTVSREQFRVNSGTLEGTATTYWDYNQLIGEVGLDADGDIIITYAGYGPDVSVNSIIPYIQGSSLSTTGSWTVFMQNMQKLLQSESAVLQQKYGKNEAYANLLNFFNPGPGTAYGDSFGTVTLSGDEDGTLITFTSLIMQQLVQNNPDLNLEYTGVYRCHGDVDSVISMVITNAELIFMNDPQYADVADEAKATVLGALAAVLESQFGTLRGDSTGIMYTQVDASANNGMATSTILHSDSVANDKRDGVTAVADISLDVQFNRVWDAIVVRIGNIANGNSVDVTVNPIYDDLGNGLFRINAEQTAEAIEAAISAQTTVVGTSWRDQTNDELDLYEGPVEVRVVDWEQIQTRGLMHIGNEDTRYTNSSMDMQLVFQWYTDNQADILEETGVAAFADLTFQDILDFVNTDDLVERAQRINDFPAFFEIVYQGSVHDLEITTAWRNSTLQRTERQLLTLIPDQNGLMYYAIQVDGNPANFTEPAQLLTFNCTNEQAVQASLNALQNYLENLGYESVEVELTLSPDGFGPGEYQIEIRFPGQVGDNITVRFIDNFPLPVLNDNGGYDPALYPWIANGGFTTIQNGGTVNRVLFGTSMYYFGDLGTSQTDSRINVTPEGDFQISWLQNELYNSRNQATNGASSSSGSYSNTNICIRPFDEATDTAGPKMSGINIDGHRIQQEGQISKDDINYLVVYFNEEMMYYDKNSGFSNSEAGKWDNSVINPDNWLLLKDGIVVTNGIADVIYGMNISQYVYDENGDPISEYGSNKWEVVVSFEGPLESGTYELVALSSIEDVKGNYLNKNGENPEGANSSFTFNVVAFEDPERVNDDVEFIQGEQYFTREESSGQSMLVWSPKSNAMDGDGNSITVWISETTADDGGKQQEICYRIDYVGSELDGTGNITENVDYYTIYNTPMQTILDQTDILKCASVAMSEDGDFIITWSEYSTETGWDVYARRFNLDGTAKDNITADDLNANHRQLIINDTVEGDQLYSSVAISSLGEYVIAWQSKDESEDEDWDIYASQFNADGTSKVDHPETQEIIFSDQINNGAFRLQYAIDQKNVLTSDIITINAAAGTVSYGNVVLGNSTPENIGKAITMALDSMNIDATVTAKSYTYFSIEVNSFNGNKVTKDFEELAVQPTTNLKAVDGTAIYASVNTKYDANSGEFLVNQSYMLESGKVEKQVVSFGTGEGFRNILSFKLSFTYYDAQGVFHSCSTVDPIVLHVWDTANGGNGTTEDGLDPDTDGTLTDEMIANIIEQLGNIKDQYGNTITISDDANAIDATTLAADTVTNSITLNFAGDVIGLDISNVSITNVVKRDESWKNPTFSVVESVKGTMGGIVSDVTKREIAANSANYTDLQTNDQMFASVAMDSVGNFVITWSSFGDPNYNEKATESNVYARRFDSDGKTVVVGLVNTNVTETDAEGNVTIVKNNVAGTQKWSSVAMDRSGEFVITWTSIVDGNADVYAKRYTFLQAYYSGQAAASALDPNAADAGAYYTEAYSYNDAGFLCDYKGQPIYFHGNGATPETVENYASLDYKAVSDSFMVNTTAVGNQQYSKVAIDGAGNFVITWESDDFSSTGTNKLYKMYAQRFNGNDTLTATDKIGKFGNELLFGDAYSKDSDRFPSVAMSANGDWVIDWTRFYDKSSAEYISGNTSDIYQVKNMVALDDDDVSPIITKFQAVSPLQQGDLFVYLLDSKGNIVTDELGNAVFTWKDTEQRYSIDAATNSINTVDSQGRITSLVPLNDSDNPSYVYNDKTQKLYVYTAGGTPAELDVTVTNDLPYGDDFTKNGLLNYIYSLDESGAKEYSYTDLASDPFYLDIDSGKIYNQSVILENIQDKINDGDPINDNAVSIIVGFSEEMSTAGSTSILNPSNWQIYQTDIDGTKTLVPIEDIVLREDSMFSEGSQTGRQEIVIYLEPSENGLPALQSGYSYEFIGSDKMEDLNENQLDGTYSQWHIDGTNGAVGGTDSGDFNKIFDVGVPSSAGSGNVSDKPEDFKAEDLDSDTLVNSVNQAGIQENSSVATDKYGNYIVVWETDWITQDNSDDYQKNPDLTRSLYNNGNLVATNNDQSNAFRRIMAQMFDSNGNKVGEEFVVCLEEYTHQTSPDVAMDDYGNIVITWVELSDTTGNHVEDSLAGDTEIMTLDPYVDGTSILAVRYTTTYDDDNYAISISPVGTEGNQVFQVDTNVAGVKTNPKVAIDSTTGNFVIVWCNTDGSSSSSLLQSSNYYPGGTVDRGGIYARIYSFSSSAKTPTPTSAASYWGATGNVASLPFLVNSADNVSQSAPAVAMENGNLVVAWQSAESVTQIVARSFNVDNNGVITAAYTQQTVNQNTVTKKSTPSISMDLKGNAIIVWSSLLQDGSEYGIYGRTYKVGTNNVQSMDSALSQGEFRVNTTTFDTQIDPSVALAENGRCVVSWTSFGGEKSDYDTASSSYSTFGVFAKWYDDVFTNAYLGTTITDVQINSLIYGSQFQSDVAINRDGQSVFTWTGPGRLSTNYVTNGDNAGEGGNNVTNTYDNLENGAGMAGVSNHVSALDYSDIYRRRFLWTAASNTPTTLSPDYKPETGTGGTFTPSTNGSTTEFDVGSSSSQTVLTSVSDGTWTIVVDDVNKTSELNGSKSIVLNGSGGSITIYGSSGADTVSFSKGTKNGETIDVITFTNSMGQTVTLSDFDEVNFVGRGGSDSVVFDNMVSDSDSRIFTASGTMATLTTATKAYTYTVTDFASITFEGTSGDSVVISDTLGTDLVAVTDSSVTATGAGYSITADNFSKLSLKSSLGTDSLTFDVGNATDLTADGNSGTMTTTQYVCDFAGFANVAATVKTSSGSTNSGRASAEVTINSEDSVISMYSSRTTFTESGTSWTLNNFGNVTVNVASEAAEAKVNIYDTAGNDYFDFNASVKTAQMSLANGYVLKSVGSNNVNAFSKYGGTDTATVTGSAAADTVTMGPRMVTITDADLDNSVPATYKAVASGFAIINASSSDGLDSVFFTDTNSIASSDVKDEFYVSYSGSGVSAVMQSTAKTNYTNTATGFANITATSSSTTAIDTARVIDGTDDYAATLVTASPETVNMISAKANITVNGFRNVDLTSNTEVSIKDGVNNDVLAMQAGMASVSGTNAAGATYTLTVNADKITAESLNGGSDTVTIICSDDFAETIDVNHTAEKMIVTVADTDGSYRNKVTNFKNTNITKANTADTANVEIKNYNVGVINAVSSLNSFSYTQDGSKGKNLSITGAVKELNVTMKNSVSGQQAVNVLLHDSALADQLDVTTVDKEVVMTQVSSSLSRSFTNATKVEVFGGTDAGDTKTVDSVITDWSDWSATEDWLDGSND